MGPAVYVAPDWRDPLTGLATKHLASRLTRRRPAPRWAHQPSAPAAPRGPL